MMVIVLFAFTSDFRGCDVHRTTGARDEGPHRLAHDTEPRRGDCDFSMRQPMRTFPRDPGLKILYLLCGHHTHEASEVKATTRTICTERAASHLIAFTTKTLIRVYICYNSSFHREYISPLHPPYFSSAVVVEHPVDWRVGDEVVDDPVQRVGVVDLVETLRVKLLDVRHVGPHHDTLHHDQLEQDPG